MRRKSIGSSQEDLAEKTGLHRTYIGTIERKKRNVSLSTLEALASGLDCGAADLLRDKGRDS